jgi:hypothetical protein
LKKRTKKLLILVAGVGKESKVFCFFSSEKKALLSFPGPTRRSVIGLILTMPLAARAADADDPSAVLAAIRQSGVRRAPVMLGEEPGYRNPVESTRSGHTVPTTILNAMLWFRAQNPEIPRTESSVAYTKTRVPKICG